MKETMKRVSKDVNSWFVITRSTRIAQGHVYVQSGNSSSRRRIPSQNEGQKPSEQSQWDALELETEKEKPANAGEWQTLKIPNQHSLCDHIADDPSEKQRNKNTVDKDVNATHTHTHTGKHSPQRVLTKTRWNRNKQGKYYWQPWLSDSTDTARH